jgi:hypothetical protein
LTSSRDFGIIARGRTGGEGSEENPTKEEATVKIQEKDRYHGAALTQIVEHPSFKALNRASEKYGHYIINTDRNIFVKYRTNNKTPWQFGLKQEELVWLNDNVSRGDKVYLCLVCGVTTVCALEKSEINTLVDLASSDSQYIGVDVPKGGSCHLSGSKGKLKKTIPHSSFPDKVFS